MMPSKDPNKAQAAPFRMKLKRQRKRKLGQSSNAFETGSGSSSSGSSSEDDEGPMATPVNAGTTTDVVAKEVATSNDLVQPDGWRVKLYRLKDDGSWGDCGTGRITCSIRASHEKSAAVGTDEWLFQETGEATLCVQSEVSQANTEPKILLRTRILLRDAYQRQGDNIITWCEPSFDQTSGNGKESQDKPTDSSGADLALSFQDNAGCLDIWRQITKIQQFAGDLLRNHNNRDVASLSVDVVANRAATAENQRGIWSQAQSEPEPNGTQGFGNVDFENVDQAIPTMPDPPRVQDLGEVAETLSSLHNNVQLVAQKEALAIWIAKDDCTYLKALMALIESPSPKPEDLQMLAICVKSILLMNEPSILEYVVTESAIFEQVCACLENDPSLKTKANHTGFLKKKTRFRTVIVMKDAELVAAIHRSFRVGYMRDVLLRPTMDEGSLSTLNSLQTFTHADVVKGVMIPGSGTEGDIQDSYLMQVIRMFAVEVYSITAIRWNDLSRSPTSQQAKESQIAPEPTLYGEKTDYEQHLAPQDGSFPSRQARKRSCLLFLRELFNMVRLSVQPGDKDNFFPVVCNCFIELAEHEIVDDTAHGGEVPKHAVTTDSLRVSLLPLLGCILCDVSSDFTEKDCALDIISCITMHDPGLVRQCCLRDKESGVNMIERPNTNTKNQVILSPSPDDLISSLLYTIAVEQDAGILLQATEILRILLDTDMMGDHGLTSTFEDEQEGIASSAPASQQDDINPESGASTSSAEQKEFLSLFYDHYVPWLVAPFHLTLLLPTRRVPALVFKDPDKSETMKAIQASFKGGVTLGNKYLQLVSPSNVRCSFAIELLSFCVRAHLFRMKFFLLKSRIIGTIVQLASGQSFGDRALKLAALRFLRAVISINDDSYNRHIIQHNIFDIVFEAFRSNPVDDNLVSSAVIEICDHISRENITCLVEHIATKHLNEKTREAKRPTLEEISHPYVPTFVNFRKTYEESLHKRQQEEQQSGMESPGGTRYLSPLSRLAQRNLSGKALEDQIKFRAADAEESYFDTDDDPPRDHVPVYSTPPVAVDEIEMEQLRPPALKALGPHPTLPSPNK